MLERKVKKMKVILKQDIKGVGKKNEVINASDGYARNYLFPKNLAVEANAENMSKLNSQNEAKQYKKEVEKEQAKEIAKKLKLSSSGIKIKLYRIRKKLKEEIL